jgi:ribosomal-protein-alanine N-acetyltransferase
MEFKFKHFDENYANNIANWHYEGIYAFYDMDQDIEDLEELQNSRNWVDKYFGVVNESNELIGFFCFEQENGGVIIGLGLRPDLTGIGLGEEFVEAGLKFAKKKYSPNHFSLSVALFNQRAIRVYEKVGFKSDGVFKNNTNDGEYEFLRMVRDE